MNADKIGIELKLARVRADKSQQQIADAVGVDKSLVCLIENGKRRASGKLLEDLKVATGWDERIGLILDEYQPERVRT